MILLYGEDWYDDVDLIWWYDNVDIMVMIWRWCWFVVVESSYALLSHDEMFMHSWWVQFSDNEKRWYEDGGITQKHTSDIQNGITCI